MQKEKDNIDQLRKRLQDCEDYILRIAKPFEGYWDKATEEVIAASTAYGRDCTAPNASGRTPVEIEYCNNPQKLDEMEASRTIHLAKPNTPSAAGCCATRTSRVWPSSCVCCTSPSSVS
jgi:hypothetical protein